MLNTNGQQKSNMNSALYFENSTMMHTLSRLMSNHNDVEYRFIVVIYNITILIKPK